MILCTTPDLLEYVDKIKGSTNTSFVKVGSINSLQPAEKNKVTIIISYGNYEDQLTIEDLEQLPNLKWVQIFSSGTEQLPNDYLKNRKIIVTTVRGIHAIPISEYVVGMLLYQTKKIKQFEDEKERKNWNQLIISSELFGKKIAILGTGVIGKEIAKKAQAFGMNVIGYNRSKSKVDGFDVVFSITELLNTISEVDFICSILPSNPESKGIIDKELIASMKKGVGIINVGRGDAIDENAFTEALLNNHIGWAAFDVFEKEPLPREHVFWTLENLVITPHASAMTPMYLERAVHIFEENYSIYKMGEVQSMINKVL